MAFPERFLFGFAYHRVGPTNRWKPSCASLRRIEQDHTWTGPQVLLSLQTDHIVWIDVAAEEEAGRNINDLSHSCEERADAEFRRLFPDKELAGPQ
jgi:hypothetical protein